MHKDKSDLVVYKIFESRATSKLSTTVEPSGIDISRPPQRKLKSPGSLPKPQRFNAGANQPISIRASRVIKSQRNMGFLSQRVAAVAVGKTEGFKLG